MSLTIYLAGPMRGYPNFNFQTFEDATTALRDMGFDVISPHQWDIDTHRVSAVWQYVPDKGTHQLRRVFTEVKLAPDFDFEDTMNEDLRLIEDHCQGIVLLPGWGSSEGAQREFDLAYKLGLNQYYYSPEDAMLTRLDDTDAVRS